MNWQRTVSLSAYGGGSWDAPENEEVWTKIDDKHGERNVQKLIRRGNLWYTHSDPEKGIYVYYTPTHWRRDAAQ